MRCNNKVHDGDEVCGVHQKHVFEIIYILKKNVFSECYGFLGFLFGIYPNLRNQEVPISLIVHRLPCFS